MLSRTNKSQNKYFQIKLKIQESFSDYHSVKLLRIGHRYNDLQSDLTKLSIWATTFTCFRFSFSSDRIVLIKVIECTARQKIKTIKHSIEIRHDAYHPSQDIQPKIDGNSSIFCHVIYQQLPLWGICVYVFCVVTFRYNMLSFVPSFLVKFKVKVCHTTSFS